MNEEKHKSRAWIWACVALMVLYPLSIGPVTWFCLRTGISFDWIYTFYRPIDFAMDKCEPFHRIFMWYFELWL